MQFYDQKKYFAKMQKVKFNRAKYKQKMSTQYTLKKINSLLLEIKERLREGQFELPLIRCTREFDLKKKVMIRRHPTSITFKKTSVSYILRVVQILTIIRNLLLNSKFITKRNLYYQLVKYYHSYMVLDEDLLIVCDTLKLERSQLNLIVSNNLQLFWFNVGVDKSREIRVELSYKKFTQQQQNHTQNCAKNEYQLIEEPKPSFIQKQHILLLPQQIFKMPNCPRLEINILYPPFIENPQKNQINLLIMEKQSLFEILSQSLTYKPPSNNQNWFLMHSKGYPDMTALQFINQMLRFNESQPIHFYYIGDYDVYGIDIMFNYAIGNQVYKGMWDRLKWICLFDEFVEFQDVKFPGFKKKFQQTEYQKVTLQDKKKTKQILARDYLNLDKIIQSAQFHTHSQQQLNELFLTKVKGWRQILQRLAQNQHQCEVESYFKNWQYPFDLIELLISKQFYI